MAGDKIIKILRDLKNRGLPIIDNSKDDEKNYTLTGKEYRIEISIKPLTFLGLEFYLLDKNGKTILTYDIDTDLYPISKSKYETFTDEIESEIVSLLKNIDEQKILIGNKNGKSAMIIPKDDEYLLIVKGYFFTKSSIYNSLEAAKLNGEYKPL